MGRIVIAVIVLVLIGVAVWAALPATPPLAAPSLPSLPPIAASPTVPVARREAARPPAEAPSPAADGDLDAKIAACVAAQAKVGAARAQRGGPAPAGQPSDAAVVSAACAPLYKQPACRDAMVHFDAPPPAERSRTVLAACAKAYCGELPAPKPSVCANPDNVPEDQQQFIAWNELRDAILKHDIGATAAERVLSPPDRGR
ncbi:MAG TPA: hypothetical protein VF334_09410 [Polyangia bacterium]